MPEMTEREKELRAVIADLREECAKKDKQIEQQTAELAILSRDRDYPIKTDKQEWYLRGLRDGREEVKSALRELLNVAEIEK